MHNTENYIYIYIYIERFIYCVDAIIDLFFDLLISDLLTFLSVCVRDMCVCMLRFSCRAVCMFQIFLDAHHNELYAKGLLPSKFQASVNATDM